MVLEELFLSRFKLQNRSCNSGKGSDAIDSRILHQITEPARGTAVRFFSLVNRE